MRRFRFLLATSTVALAVLAPGAGVWAQGKPAGSQPPTPASTTSAAAPKPGGAAPTGSGTGAATAPKPGGTSAAAGSKPGGAGAATSGTSGTGAAKAGTGTGSGTSGTQGASSPATPGTGTAAGTGTGTAAGTGTGTGAGTGAGTGTGTGAGAGMGTGAGATGAGQPADSAESLFRKGNELAKEDKWAESEPLYRAAWKLKQSYDIAANLGLALYQQKKWRESAEFLDIALRSFPASGKPQNRALLESAFTAVKGEVGAVTIDVSVNGARVLVDGKEVGVSPLRDTVFVDPGKRTIEATLEEYEPGKKTIDAAKGSSQALKLTLTPKPKPKPKVAEGWKPPVYVYIAGGAAAAVGLGLGIGMTVAANGKSSHADELRTGLGGTSPCYQPMGAAVQTCGEILDSLKAQGTFSNVAVGSFVVGGIFALGTAGLFAYSIMKPTASDEEVSPAPKSAHIIPVFNATQGGAMLVGTW